MLEKKAQFKTVRMFVGLIIPAVALCLANGLCSVVAPRTHYRGFLTPYTTVPVFLVFAVMLVLTVWARRPDWRTYALVVAEAMGVAMLIPTIWVMGATLLAATAFHVFILFPMWCFWAAGIAMALCGIRLVFIVPRRYAHLRVLCAYGIVLLSAVLIAARYFLPGLCP